MIHAGKAAKEIRYAPAEYITADDAGDGSVLDSLVTQIADTINRQGWNKAALTVSLSGLWYRSQTHLSPFHDQKQIMNTLKYDIEEELAVDADETVLCFQKACETDDGSHLMVHTAEIEQLQNLFDRFEQVEKDVLVAEPDVVSWWHYLQDAEECPRDQASIAVGWAADTLSLLVMNDAGQPILTRSLPSAAGEQATELLEYELTRCLATLPENHQPRILLFHAGGLNTDGINAQARSFQMTPQMLSLNDMTQACAIGIAANYLNRKHAVDFRTDGMTPQTVIKEKERALFSLSGAVCLILLAAIIVNMLHADGWEKIENQATRDIHTAYKSVFPDKRTPMITRAKRELEGRLDEIEKKIEIQNTKVLPDSASNTLTRTFEALNVLSLDFDIQISDMRFDASSASINGSVPNYHDMEKLYNVFSDTDTPLSVDSLKLTNESGPGNRQDPTRRSTFLLRISAVERENQEEKGR